MGGLGFTKDFFFLCLLTGKSLHWCLIKLFWTTWGSLATCLICLVVTFELSIFFASWLTLLVGNLSRSVVISDCLGDKLFIFKEESKDVPMTYLGSLWGVLSQSNQDMYYIVLFINWLVSLSEAWNKIKPEPHFIRLWFAEVFKLLPNGIKH